MLALWGNVHTSGHLFLLFHLCTACRHSVSMIHTHIYRWLGIIIYKIQLSTMDLLALASMKNTAKCDK